MNVGSPRLSIYLLPAQLARLREIADARNVSMSQAVREAIDLALTQWGFGLADGSEADQMERRRPGPPAPVGWTRERRRQAAREGRSGVNEQPEIDPEPKLARSGVKAERR